MGDPKRPLDGKMTILWDCLRCLRGRQRQPTPFIRYESRAGQQMQIDWGHFGVLAYGQSMRKLYALSVIEGYSRAA
jgi:hypothetical protein